MAYASAPRGHNKRQAPQAHPVHTTTSSSHLQVLQEWGSQDSEVAHRSRRCYLLVVDHQQVLLSRDPTKTNSYNGDIESNCRMDSVALTNTTKNDDCYVIELGKKMPSLTSNERGPEDPIARYLKGVERLRIMSLDPARFENCTENQLIHITGNAFAVHSIGSVLITIFELLTPQDATTGPPIVLDPSDDEVDSQKTWVPDSPFRRQWEQVGPPSPPSPNNKEDGERDAKRSCSSHGEPRGD